MARMTKEEIELHIKAYKMYLGMHPDTESREDLEESIKKLEADLKS